MIEWTSQPGDQDTTVLAFLQRQIPAAPLSYLKLLLKKGKVRGAQGPLSADDLLQPGDVLQVPESGRLRELLAAPKSTTQQLQLLYESREILVVDKPAGLAVHASQGHETDNLTARVEALLRQRGLSFKVAPVHRLDLETSGPLLFGKGKQACARLGQLFMQQQVEKCYLALVAGRTPGSGLLHSQLTAKGKLKQARTGYRALQRNATASLLELQLQTGRQHQIRRQLAELGHPLFGDRRYRGPCPPQLPRMFLHCCRLSFVDPFSGAPVSVNSPLPEELQNFLPYCQLTQTPA